MEIPPVSRDGRTLPAKRDREPAFDDGPQASIGRHALPQLARQPHADRRSLRSCVLAERRTSALLRSWFAHAAARVLRLLATSLHRGIEVSRSLHEPPRAELVFDRRRHPVGANYSSSESQRSTGRRLGIGTGRGFVDSRSAGDGVAVDVAAPPPLGDSAPPLLGVGDVVVLPDSFLLSFDIETPTHNGIAIPSALTSARKPPKVRCAYRSSRARLRCLPARFILISKY